MKLVGELPARHDGHRPGAHGHPDAPEEGRGRQVRRVLRARALARSASPIAPPSPTWRRSTAPPWASSRWTPRRCAISSAPAAERAVCERVERYCQGAGPVPHRRDARPRVHRDARARPGHGRRRAWPGPSGRRTWCRSRELKRNFVVNLPGLMSANVPVGAEGAGRERLLALDGRGRRQRDDRRHGAAEQMPRSRQPILTRRRS